MQSLTLQVNGKPLFKGDPSPFYTAVTGTITGKAGKTQPPAVTGYVQLPINDLSMFARGANALQVEIHNGRTAPAVLSEVQLGVKGKS